MSLWHRALKIPRGVDRASAYSADARVDFATTCVDTQGIKIPAVVDGNENATERAYTGWPSRLYLIGMDGRIRFKGAPGPYGFSSKHLEEAIEKEDSLASTT